MAVDRTTGAVYMIVCGQGVWRSSDKGATFERVDGQAVGGRCETGCSLRFDPAGKRLACFMLDGKSARTDDGGKTWKQIGTRYRAVGIFPGPVLLCGREKQEGIFRSTDGGGTWTKVSEATAVGVMTVFKGTGHWLTNQGLPTTADLGKTWKLIAPLPPSLKKEFNPRGWFLNVAWDPVGKVCYASRMGQPTWKCEY